LKNKNFGQLPKEYSQLKKQLEDSNSVIRYKGKHSTEGLISFTQEFDDWIIPKKLFTFLTLSIVKPQNQF